MGKQLPDKYERALALIKADDLTYRDIAAKCGISESTLYDMIEGRTENYGPTAIEFHRRLTEIQKEMDKEIRQLIKSNKKHTHKYLNKYLKGLKQRSVTKAMMPTLISVANALAKSTPKVEIGSFSYTQGISAEELAYEFKRLNAGSREIRSDGGTISQTFGGRSEEIPLGEARIPPDAEESEVTSLQAESETRPIPPLPSEH